MKKAIAATRRTGTHGSGRAGVCEPIQKKARAALPSGIDRVIAKRRRLPTRRLTASCAGYLQMNEKVERHAAQKEEPSMATKMKP